MKLKVLVACEESQAVTKAFRALGHEAYSCDLLPCSGGHPEWHYQQDITELLSQKWDIIIAHPPCTHLTVSGARHFKKKRLDGRQKEGIEFFCKFLNVDCGYVAIENPVGIISGDYIKEYFPELCSKYGLPLKSSQQIQPWQFGDKFSKTTCLWLKGLPNLTPTDIVDKGEFKEWVDTKTGKIKRQATWYYEALLKAKTPQERSTLRSKTFPGIANAMASQWSEYVINKKLGK